MFIIASFCRNCKGLILFAVFLKEASRVGVFCADKTISYFKQKTY